MSAALAMGPRLVKLSQWIDAPNANKGAEAIVWGRVAKVSEEAGEAIAALIGWTGQNPRKGVTHTRDDVVDELLDVAIAALGAVEHLTDHRGTSITRMQRKLERVLSRAGLE